MAQHTDPVLRYDGRVWRGEDSSMDVWMSDATFQSYVTAYLQTIDITEPTTD